MKIQLANSKLVMAAAASLLVMSFTAKAELKIQSAQYKAQKESLYVKGKFDGGAREVYVIDADTRRLIASVDTRGKQFLGDISISERSVPCMVLIQTTRPSSRGRRSSRGEFSVAEVRHAPDHCSD